MTQQNKHDRTGGTPREVPTERHEQGHELRDRPPQQQQGGSQGRTQLGSSAPQESQRNEGEGNRTAARAYNRNVQQTAENPSEVKRQAEGARRALEGAEGAALKRAEAEGRKPARR